MSRELIQDGGEKNWWKTDQSERVISSPHSPICHNIVTTQISKKKLDDVWLWNYSTKPRFNGSFKQFQGKYKDAEPEGMLYESSDVLKRTQSLSKQRYGACVDGVGEGNYYYVYE